MKRQHSMRRCAAGFLLWEIMVLIGLLAIVTLIAGRVFWTSSRAAYESSERQRRELLFDNALNALRKDVWEAQTLDCRDDQHLRIDASGGQLDWTGGKLLARTTRTPTASRQDWHVSGAQFAFEVNGPVVTVRITESSGGAIDQITLLCQRMLLEKAGK